MDIYLKKDYMQYTGSFKERGARYTLLMLSDEQKKKGVIAASAGNHALACINLINSRKAIKVKNPNASLREKYGWKGDLSRFLFRPRGLEEPVWCRNKRCTPLSAAKINGRRK